MGRRAIPDVARVHLAVQGHLEHPHDGYPQAVAEGVGAIARWRSCVHNLVVVELALEIGADHVEGTMPPPLMHCGSELAFVRRRPATRRVGVKLLALGRSL